MRAHVRRRFKHKISLPNKEKLRSKINFVNYVLIDLKLVLLFPKNLTLFSVSFEFFFFPYLIIPLTIVHYTASTVTDATAFYY